MVSAQDYSADILLVEDNRDIAENIIEYLEKRQFTLDYAADGQTAKALLDNQRYQLLILDVMLPDTDGFALATHIRYRLKIDTPILFLTARDTLDDKLQGFSVGGDDYLTKPFAMEELAARVRAFSKRASGNVIEVMEVGPWRLEINNYQLFYKNVPVKTTKVGLKIFRELLVKQPNVILRSDLENAIWQGEPPHSDALRSHIFTLRKALSAVCENTRIETVHSIGFRLMIEC